MADFYLPPTVGAVQSAIDGLTSRGVKLPKVIATAVERAKAVAENRPADLFAPPTVVSVILADPGDAAAISEALLVEHARVLRESAWRRAEVAAAEAVIDLLVEHGEDLTGQLAAHAEPLIGRLQSVAELGDATVGELLRSGRDSDARALADADVCAAELDAAYGARRWLLPDQGRAVRGLPADCSRWRDADRPPEPGQFLPGLRAGSRLWFPSWRQMFARADELVTAGEPATQVG